MTQIIQKEMPEEVWVAGDAVLWHAFTGQPFTEPFDA